LGRIAFRRTFDLQHLCFLHRWLFQDVYSWAGATRSIPMHKEGSEFARPEYIEDYAKQLFESLRAEHNLRDVPLCDLPDRVAFYFSEINALHPFREGNGRTQRLFLRHILQLRSIGIAWERVAPEENIAVSIAAYNGNEIPAKDLFARILEPF
jgi:cell filamentation protein